MRRVKFGVLSFAHPHAYSYARVLRELPNAEVTAVYDDDEERGKEAAKQCKAEYYNDYEKLLRRDDVEAAIITSENAKHYELAVAAAEYEKHILCEKPIAVKLENADEMIKRAERRDVKFQMCYVMRYHTVTNLVKQLIDEGRIGEIVAMIGTNRLNSAIPLSTEWFLNKELSGGGAIMDHTVHLADLMRWYSKSEAVEVYTEVGKNVNVGIPVEDTFITTLTFRSGAIGSIDGSWCKPPTYPTWGEVAMEIVGTEGMILLDSFRQVIYLYGVEEPHKGYSWHYYGCDMNEEMIKDFINCIVEDREPKATGFDGRQGLEITLASYKSASEGRVIRLPLK